eukprot:CAMPEP_0206058366 /NCGR_PEP_ID=MMETSP1466-20131121/46513_1 /ASSEMBLY_ACC=CAM_ASM_001126 /TAXON_ID=44452 /ORGANISM="Pavlova gyrans, Strain CCMP608" /LENGTH=112 /DNA_ID=CAMNT_0053433663 /DNA_START=229 /DNA_END=567 /DNA_ORIENTATION=+
MGAVSPFRARDHSRGRMHSSRIALVVGTGGNPLVEAHPALAQARALDAALAHVAVAKAAKPLDSITAIRFVLALAHRVRDDFSTSGPLPPLTKRFIGRSTLQAGLVLGRSAV